MQYPNIQSEGSQETQKNMHIASVQKNNSSPNYIKDNFYITSIGATAIIISILFCVNKYHTYRIQEQVFPYQSYNQHLKGQIFGNFSELYLSFNQINLKWDQNRNNKGQLQAFISKNKNYQHYRIQIGSILDYGLTQLINFDEIQKIFYQKVSYQIFWFQYKQQLEGQVNLVKKQFNNQQQIEYFLDSLARHSKARQKTIEYNLAIQLIKDQNNNKLLEAQYYLADKKYDIGNQKKQKPICIYSAGMDILKKKDRYLKYFQQIEKLNYTNFHIVYVDDFSQDNSFQAVYNYLKQSKLRIRNRIKLVHNFQQLGVLANMYLWIKKFCNSDDIIVIVDADDKVIGRQSLKIFNSVYQAPMIWYAYSKYILTRAREQDQYKDYQKDFESGYSSAFLKYKTQDYRISFDWSTSLMRSFRKKLLDSVPIESLIQYHYDNSLDIAWPSFYKYGADMFLVYAQLQIAGNQRIVHIQDFLYLYFFVDYINKDCHREQQIYDGYKSKIKTPLAMASSLGQKAQMIKNYKIPQEKLKIVSKSFIDSIECDEKLKKKKEKNIV